ncbi:MAG: response regulator [Chloroflexota bacterium]
MSDRIRVAIVDDIPETREHLAKLLSFEQDMEVVGTGGSGPDALEIANRLHPDVILMDVNMPGFDGIAAAEQLSVASPTTAIVMMSVQGESDYLRRSMLAGAREFLVKPFSSDELCAAIRQVHVREREKIGRIVPAATAAAQPAGEKGKGKVISVFSPKGGVGRTTIAVNLAVALASGFGRSVALVDACLQFGDVGVLLNLNPRTRSVMDVLVEPGRSSEAIDAALLGHSAGVRVMLAPPSPEMAELVTVDHLRRVIERLRETHDYVVVDCPPVFQDHTLAVLDASDLILGVLTLEITSIKNVRLFLELAHQLGYPEERIRIVLNRADSAFGIRVVDVEATIGRKVDHTVVSDGRKVVYALNRGVPFVWSALQAQVSQDIVTIARSVVDQAPVEPTAAPTRETGGRRKGLFGRR